MTCTLHALPNYGIFYSVSLLLPIPVVSIAYSFLLSACMYPLICFPFYSHPKLAGMPFVLISGAKVFPCLYAQARQSEVWKKISTHAGRIFFQNLAFC
jgi:hypothetical protein